MVTRKDWLFAIGIDHVWFEDQYDGTYGFAIYEGRDQPFRSARHQTTSYELSPTSSIGGRLVVRNGQSNWYLSYRNYEDYLATCVLAGNGS